MRRRRGLALAVGVGLAASAALAVLLPGRSRGGTSRSTFTRASDSLVLEVPHVAGDITLDGDMDDPGWANGCARTGAFAADEGGEARPYSDLRAVWDSRSLYLALYAADQDIRAEHEGRDAPVWLDDSFHLLFETDDAEYSFDVSAQGVVADGIRKKGATHGGPFDFSWNSDVHASHEIDGTINQPLDNDEEWVIEMVIPWDAFGLRGVAGETLGFSAKRCDTFAASGVRSCGSWGRNGPHGVIVLSPALGESPGEPRK